MPVPWTVIFTDVDETRILEGTIELNNDVITVETCTCSGNAAIKIKQKLKQKWKENSIKTPRRHAFLILSRLT